jgi:hypothetical protein
VATGFAFSYVVGYFLAFDISSFSFFSLSEHVVFALWALPIAIGAPSLGARSAGAVRLALGSTLGVGALPRSDVSGHLSRPAQAHDEESAPTRKFSTLDLSAVAPKLE